MNDDKTLSLVLERMDWTIAVKMLAYTQSTVSIPTMLEHSNNYPEYKSLAFPFLLPRI